MKWLENRKNRIEWIDYYKAFAIILVLIGHISENKVINNWIYLFHMPAFIFISGLLYNENKSNMKKRLKNILIPYFSFSILSFAYWLFIERNLRNQLNINPFSVFINIFLMFCGNENYIYNIPLWFLPALFMIETISSLLLKIKGNEKIKLFVIIILSIMISYFLSKYLNIYLPFALDCAMILLPFFILGMMVNKKIIKFPSINNSYGYVFLAIVSFIVICLCVYSGCRVDINNLLITNYFVFIISSFNGIIFLYSLSKIVKIKYLQWLGINSLCIMLIHEPIKRIVLQVLSKVTKIELVLLRTNFFFVLIDTILLILILIPIVFVVNEYFGYLLGRKVKNE